MEEDRQIDSSTTDNTNSSISTTVSRIDEDPRPPAVEQTTEESSRGETSAAQSLAETERYEEPLAGTSRAEQTDRTTTRKKRAYRRGDRPEPTSLRAEERARLQLELLTNLGSVMDNSSSDEEPDQPRAPGANDEDSSSSSSSTSSMSSYVSLLDQARRKKVRIESEPDPEVLKKTKPKHKWFITPEFISRERGYSNRVQGAKLFEQRMHGSLHSVQRLELMYKLTHHTGCVNSLSFNSAGTLLASCSDDLSVCIWDWPVGKLLSSVYSGHKSNVLQVKFLPLQGHIYVATCARDGQVRILELDSGGSLAASRRVVHHSRPCHKLSLVPNSPNVFLSCGEDSVVFSVDTRQTRGKKILTVTSESSRVPLYTISCNPADSNEFMVGGRNKFLRLYDRRSIKTAVHTLCPSNLKNNQQQAYITSAVYNYDGTQMLTSYNDDDIYLWDRKDNLNDFVHKYQGHRNNATIKGVNFFGPRSEYVVSGSDCGNIYFWDRETEAIVQWMAGDENGVVNCLEPHRGLPILATSGLDEDVKIWVPSCEQEPKLDGLKSAVIINLTDREEDRSVEDRTDDDSDGRILWLLWRNILREDQRNRNIRLNSITPRNMRSPSSPDSATTEDEEDTLTSMPGLPNCSPS